MALTISNIGIVSVYANTEKEATYQKNGDPIKKYYDRDDEIWVYLTPPQTVALINNNQKFESVIEMCRVIVFDKDGKIKESFQKTKDYINDMDLKYGKIRFCVYNFRDSIKIYVYGFKNITEEGYKFKVTKIPNNLTDYPDYIEVEAYKETPRKEEELNGISIKVNDIKGVIRNVLIFDTVDPKDFGQRMSKDNTFIEFAFSKVAVSKDIREKHFQEVAKIGNSVPEGAQATYLVPDLLAKKNEKGEYGFELRPTQTLKDVPKKVVWPPK